jgi:recombination protein RecA
VKVVKNKVAPPFKNAEFDIIYGEGISSVGELVDLAIDHDAMQKMGSWYAYGEIKVGQGRESAKTWLRENAKFRGEIESKVKTALGITVSERATNGAAVETEEVGAN